MKKLIRTFPETPVMKEATSLPTPGTYYAVVLDASTQVIDPLYKGQDTCFVVKWRLVNVDSLQSYELTETYNPYIGNPRTESLQVFLKSRGLETASDEELNGLRTTVEVVNEYLGGFAFPIVSFTPRTYPVTLFEDYCSEDDLPF